ncbi:MAG: flagellar hook-basal body complex protein [Ruminococcus sp.]|jgi:flagellar hook protein FlgE|nr:flagellar hook-basal body complex protein [Ruminococcus sp.]
MIRSLYSGVAGMTTQQTKMDVIGNNIANVSTYGFKSSRVTFRDVYYQTSSAASGPSASQGGRNAVQVGYGSTLGSTDVNHSQSVMSTTGLSLDCAIAGEGYFQVMDGEGNKFYTKAGMLDIDASGNLVDVNGNFVLGVSGNNMNQGASSQKIKITLPYREPSVSSASDKINGVGITLSSSNENENGNLSFSFNSSSNMPIGEKATAVVSSTSIAVTLNANETFNTPADLENAINNAIKTANSGIEHPAGEFKLNFDSDNAFTTALTGDQIVSSNFGVKSGTVDIPDSMTKSFSVSSVGDSFNYSDKMDFNIAVDDAAGTCTITAGNGKYSAVLTKQQMASAGSAVMKSATTGDSFVLTFPNWTNIQSYNGTSATAENASVPSASAKNLGLGAASFALSGGTEGGIQTVSDLTGLAIASNGVIYGTHPTLGTIELGRIDLATFDNPSGLSQVGSTYFSATANSGKPKLTIAGSDGSGDLAGGTLENSNVDLSQEFSDMIVTQRGFQASSRLITVSDTMLEELINLKR